jgi:hypothetical protein
VQPPYRIDFDLQEIVAAWAAAERQGLTLEMASVPVAPADGYALDVGVARCVDSLSRGVRKPGVDLGVVQQAEADLRPYQIRAPGGVDALKGVTRVVLEVKVIVPSLRVEDERANEVGRGAVGSVAETHILIDVLFVANKLSASEFEGARTAVPADSAEPQLEATVRCGHELHI